MDWGAQMDDGISFKGLKEKALKTLAEVKEGWETFKENVPDMLVKGVLPEGQGRTEAYDKYPKLKPAEDVSTAPTQPGDSPYVDKATGINFFKR